MEKLEFYSRGKLLLTGEYVVLDGAKALALPTKKGQSLSITPNKLGVINWTSIDCNGEVWYKTKLETNLLFSKKPPEGDSNLDKTLFKILWEALQLNPNFIKHNLGYQIETTLEFERLWGLGTSSTLINNIAKWANINPFELLNKSFGGSGYDIAAANASSPIFYQRNTDINNPTIEIANKFDPPFKDKLFFIYLKKKKDSKEAIQNYKLTNKKDLTKTIEQINTITSKISITNNFKEFEKLLKKHEELISSILLCKTIQEKLFKNYKGSIKSLGGWGGDFVLVTGNYVDMKYFSDKGYDTILPYADIIF